MKSCFSDHVYRGYEVELRLYRRNEEYEPVTMGSPRQIYEFMKSLRDEPCEHMYQLLMDSKKRLHGVHLVGKGGIDRCSADPAAMYKAALLSNSAAFALVHNHPSGDVTPSDEDRAVTRRVAEGSEIIGVKFLDHLIIGNSRFLSMRLEGWF